MDGQEMVADAVVTNPAPPRIPCYRRKYREFSEFIRRRRTTRRDLSLRDGHFVEDSLFEITGNYFTGTGNMQAKTDIALHKNENGSTRRGV